MSLLRLDRPLFNFDVPGSYRLAITFIGGLLLLGTVGALASMVRIGVHRNKPVGVLNKETYLIRQATLGNARGQIMKLMPQWTEGISREEIRQELVRRAEARHNSLRSKIGRWTLLVIFVLGVASWFLQTYVKVIHPTGARIMSPTTMILQLTGTALIVVPYVYRPGSWRRFWDFMSTRPLPRGWYQSLRNDETRPDAGWRHGLFWLGWGLFTLGLWRQWLGM